MNPEIKAKWLEDLRSGNFRKGRGALHKVTGEWSEENGFTTPIHEFCCLGVLCEQAVAAGVVDQRSEFGETFEYFPVGDDPELTTHTNSSYLPGVVVEWAGLDSYSPRIHVSTAETAETYALSSLNDETFSSFDEIADLIENQL